MTVDPKPLDAQTLVSGQIGPGDLVELSRQGITMVVNNRPDDEEPGQPASAALQEAAEAAGIDYRHVPISRGLGPAQIEGMVSAFSELGEGKALLFCRSGMRSTLAWALARREGGMAREELEQRAEAAGFNLAAVAHLL